MALRRNGDGKCVVRVLVQTDATECSQFEWPNRMEIWERATNDVNPLLPPTDRLAETASEAQRADRINSSADITEGEVAEGFCSCCSADIDISGGVTAARLG